MISRRRFLKRSLSTTATCLAARPALARAQDKPQPQKARVNYGFSLYGMRSLPVSDGLTVCAEIGYDSVELVANSGWPCDPATLTPGKRRDIRKQLQDLNLALPSLMENLHAVVEPDRHRKNLDRLKAAGQLGHDLSPDRPPVIETILGGRPAQWESTKEAMARRLNDWAKAAESARTVLAVKAHVGGALHTPHGARWLVDQVASPWIKLTYDYSHFQLRDFVLSDSLDLMIGQTAFIHVKDTKGKAGAFRFLLPGDGDIDYVDYFRRLKKFGYTGSVMVEVSGQIHGKPGYDPRDAARRSYQNLAPAFQQAGLKRPA